MSLLGGGRCQLFSFTQSPHFQKDIFKTLLTFLPPPPAAKILIPSYAIRCWNFHQHPTPLGRALLSKSFFKNTNPHPGRDRP